MIFDAKKELDKEKAICRLKYFFEKGKKFELTEKKEKRTISQNSYLHLILSWFALEYGETEKYVKQTIFKQWVNPDLFQTEYANRETGEIRIEWKSSASLDTGQLTLAIDRFRNYSSKEAGIYLPEPSDLAHLNEIEIEIKKHSNLIYI